MQTRTEKKTDRLPQTWKEGFAQTDWSNWFPKCQVLCVRRPGAWARVSCVCVHVSLTILWCAAITNTPKLCHGGAVVGMALRGPANRAIGSVFRSRMTSMLSESSSWRFPWLAQNVQMARLAATASTSSSVSRHRSGWRRGSRQPQLVNAPVA